ncbi:DUF4332 domain-containing protein [Geminocystis sp. NIES-3708]|uniref:DUF4332 domain-containing protein n=1 Tax=Geminocystis sp. NIES-3708 TaxID=1615909 RepID=UPI00082CFDF5|nr:DUF4332 domain-containing protein [Geminocystis sp. NIES-3708]
MKIIDIENLHGISPMDVKSLKSLGINTNLELLKFTVNSQKQQELALKIGVNHKNILKWIVLADLSRLESVGSEYCGLILHSGILSTAQLSQITASQLHRQVLRLQVATLRRKDLCPSLSLVQTWIKEAKIMS